MPDRWPLLEVESLAPDGAALAAARRCALPAGWSAAGCDDDAVWGLFVAASGEPYQTVAELAGPTTRCSCPSRKLPCKHALGLLLLWSAGHVPAGPGRPRHAEEWLARRAARAAALPASAGSAAAREADADPVGARQVRARSAGRPPDGDVPPSDPVRDQRAADRLARMVGGLVELERWVGDCIRGGLTSVELARYATWDVVAARLVDAQLGSLANRVRRVGSLVGVGADWHERVLGELATVAMLISAGQRLPGLPSDLADSVRAALGVTVRQADVLARPPESDGWQVLGRSDVLEDRIVVRRTWLRSTGPARQWALVLAFAAYGQNLGDPFPLGSLLHADVHRYPGRHELRSLIGDVAAVSPAQPPTTTSVAGACDEVGQAIAEVPWIERWPVCVAAAPTISAGRWVVTDHTGSLPLAGSAAPVPLVAATAGRPAPLVAEWTADGLVPLAVWADERLIDLGPRGGFHERKWSRAA